MKTVLPYPGGKKRIASWIINQMPPHRSYLEAFAGGLGVFFEKEPSRIETINDLDGDVVNFYRVIQNPDRRQQLCKWLDYTPYARQAYDEAFKKPRNEVERAGFFAIRAMMGHGFRLNEKTGYKKDIYGREYAYAVRYFNDLPESIAEMATRLKGVQIESKPALELIKEFNHSDVLMYLDPPYVWSTRGRMQYHHEMTDEDHKKMLIEICRSKAMVMLSGYDCELYQSYLGSWRKEQLPARAQNNLPRTETLWMNFEPVYPLLALLDT